MSDNDRHNAVQILLDAIIKINEAIDVAEDAPAAPHEMTAREFLIAYKRMCASHPETDCSKCPIYAPYKDCTDNPCDWDIDKILPAVRQWAAEHPEKRRKTYAEDFKQKFPRYRNGAANYLRYLCRKELYQGYVCEEAPRGLKHDCIACWNEVMEGEE